MTPLIGNTAPDFTAPTIMPDNSINENFQLHSFIEGRKAILVFYPLNFTFVCPTELVSLQNNLSEFEERNTVVLCLSVDSHFCHLAWKNTPTNKGGIGHVLFPMVSDINKTISQSYGVLGPSGVSYRGTIFIDEKLVVRHQSINDLPIGRNIPEMLRVVDAWTHYQTHGEVCPAGWNKGKAGMEASSEGVADYLASNADKL